MNDEPDLYPIEDRLRREAQSLSRRHAKGPSAADLRAERRRRQRRRQTRLGAAACLLLGCVGAYWLWAPSGGKAPPQPHVAEMPAHRPQDAKKQETSAAFPAAEEIAASADAPSQGEEGTDAVAFLITGPEDAGQPVIAVGVYLPPRVERINLHDLPPLQQAAVRRVLGLDEEAVKPTI